MRNNFLKRIVVSLLLISLLMGEISFKSVYAEEIVSDDSVQTENIIETMESETEVRNFVMAETETEEETEVFFDEKESEKQEEESAEELESVSVADVPQETELKADQEVHYITDIEKLNAYECRIDAFMSCKPSLEELLSVMPQTLKVCLDGSSEFTEIEVQWFCVGEDYETSNSRYFQFSPVFDETKYILDEEIDLLSEAPYIGVFLAEGDEIALLAATDSGNNETEIFSFLINEMKLNQAAASGVLANIYCESGFDPNATGDSGTSYGICQWHNTRKTSLINYCNQNGYDYTSLNGQLNYLKYELENDYPSVYKYLKNVSNTADGAYNAGYYWCYNFEIPANTANTSVVRGNLARDTYWPKYQTAEAVPVLSDVKNVSGGVTVSWYAFDGASGYYLYRKTGNESWTRIATIKGGNTLSYTDTAVESGVTYTYTIKAYTASSTTGYESQASILYLKDPAVKSAAIVDGGVRVNWEKITGAEGYRVYRKTGNGSWERIFQTGSGDTVSYTDSSVTSGTTYTYTVRAFAEGSMSAYYSQSTVLYLKDPDITGVSAVTNGVKVSWKQTAGAKGYCVYRKKKGGNWERITQIKSGSTLSYTDTSVESGMTYTYTVRAYSGSFMSIYKEQISILYLKDPDITGVNAVSGGVKVDWEKITGAAGYCVYRKKSGENWVRIAQITNGSSVSYTDKDVTGGTVYTYTVRAYSGSSMSIYQSQATIRYLTVPVLTGAAGVSDGIKVTWKKVAGATGYFVYRKMGNGSWSKIAKVTGGSTLSYTDTSAVGGTTYCYTVRAYRDAYISYYDKTGVSGTSAQTLVKYRTKEKLNYRTGPGTTYSVAGTLDAGTTVQVVDGYSTTANGYVWYKIYLGGNYYYVSSSYLEKI